MLGEERQRRTGIGTRTDSLCLPFAASDCIVIASLMEMSTAPGYLSSALRSGAGGDWACTTADRLLTTENQFVVFRQVYVEDKRG